MSYIIIIIYCLFKKQNKPEKKKSLVFPYGIVNDGKPGSKINYI